MDAILQLAMLRETAGVNFKSYVKVYEWAGEYYPQEPLVYDIGGVGFLPDSDYLKLVQDLPIDYRGLDWEWLRASHHSLSDYGSRDEESCSEPPRFESALRLALTLSPKWIVAFAWHWDQIDEVHLCGVDECIGLLRRATSSNRDRHFGFLAYGGLKSGFTNTPL